MIEEKRNGCSASFLLKSHSFQRYERWVKGGNRQRKPTHPIPQKRVIQLTFGNNIIDIHTIEEVCMNPQCFLSFYWGIEIS